MKILSLNCGSSSIRWGFYEAATEVELGSGKLEEIENTEVAWRELGPPLASLSPSALGHRVVHGGEEFSDSVLIDDDVIRAIEASSRFAPSHNPRALQGIHEARKLFPNLPHVAVFDTAFHQSMPPEAFIYPIPYEFFERDRIRRYGFHGTSHRFVSERAADRLQLSGRGFTGVTCHLGNGCSIAAIRDGRSVDTSMGMTPLEGLMMGTRSGDLDPAVVLDLVARSEGDLEGVAELLNQQSGLLGISGISSDLRAVEEAAREGNQRARLAIEIFSHRVRRGIGSALGVLGGADAIVLTGGIGENSAAMRERVVGSLEGLGVKLDLDANRGCVGREECISTADSRIAIIVIPSREEWLIARETNRLLASR